MGDLSDTIILQAGYSANHTYSAPGTYYSEAGLYYFVGSTSADSLSQYYDYDSDPRIRSWKYKVSAVDNCGNEGALSVQHKTMHLTSNFGLNNSINLIWDMYVGFSYSSYYINRYHPSTG
jgi:hypothetical protein